MIEASRENVCAIIPAHGEGRYIAQVVRGVRRYVETVYVVDDCSSDDTALQAGEAGAVVWRHSSNLGKGAAIKTGLSKAQAKQFEFYLFLDGDGQHHPDDIPKFFGRSSTAHLLVGNRMLDSAEMPRVRRYTNLFMSWQLGKLCHRPLPDSQCGFRLANRQLLPILFAANDGFAFETETLILAARQGFSIDFVPVKTIYRDERSKIKPIRDSIRYVQVMIRYRLPGRGGREAVPERG